MRSSPLLPLLLVACAGPTPEPAPAGPPNVLLIVADDQGYADLSCAGLADDVATPALDGLAARGVRFTRAYASSPICSPSRAGLMTGSYQQRFGVFWYGGPGLERAAMPTIAELLGRAGYTSGYVGKFHYGGQDRPGRRSFPLGHGFHEFYGFSGGRKHYLNHSAAAEAAFQEVKRAHDRRGQSLKQGPFWEGEELVDQVGFSTELIGARARRFLDEHRQGPFFLTVAFNAVHNFTHQLPPEYLEEQGLEGYRDWDPAVEEYYDWYQRGRYPNNPQGRAHYLGQLRYLDREVGQLLEHLDDLGLTENTLVVYIGDNGGSTPIYANNQPLRGSKYTLYEGGLRVPLIIAWPGRVPGGVVLDNVVSGMDLLPTIARAAGLEAPAAIDGLDLSPLLSGTDTQLHHEVLIWDTGHENAVRRGRWKLHIVHSANHADYELVELELGTSLRDLEIDPGETTDLSARHPEIAAQLAELHRAWREALER